MDLEQVRQEFKKHENMAYEYYVDMDHPFNNRMNNMILLHGNIAIEMFGKCIFEFPNYKSTYNIVDNYDMFATHDNVDYNKCISTLKHIVYNHENIKIKKLAIQNIWGLNEDKILKNIIKNDKINDELRHMINGLIIEQKLTTNIDDPKHQSYIHELILFFHRYLNDSINNSLKNRRLELIENDLGVKETSHILSTLCTYKGSGYWLREQIIKEISHRPELLKEFKRWVK